jgi:hypothetical protein
MSGTFFVEHLLPEYKSTLKKVSMNSIPPQFAQFIPSVGLCEDSSVKCQPANERSGEDGFYHNYI